MCARVETAGGPCTGSRLHRQAQTAQLFIIRRPWLERAHQTSRGRSCVAAADEPRSAFPPLCMMPTRSRGRAQRLQSAASRKDRKRGNRRPASDIRDPLEHNVMRMQVRSRKEGHLQGTRLVARTERVQPQHHACLRRWPDCRRLLDYPARRRLAPVVRAPQPHALDPQTCAAAAACQHAVLFLARPVSGAWLQAAHGRMPHHPPRATHTWARVGVLVGLRWCVRGDDEGEGADVHTSETSAARFIGYGFAPSSSASPSSSKYWR